MHVRDANRLRPRDTRAYYEIVCFAVRNFGLPGGRYSSRVERIVCERVKAAAHGVDVDERERVRVRAVGQQNVDALF